MADIELTAEQIASIKHISENLMKLQDALDGLKAIQKMLVPSKPKNKLDKFIKHNPLFMPKDNLLTLANVSYDDLKAYVDGLKKLVEDSEDNIKIAKKLGVLPDKQDCKDTAANLIMKNPKKMLDQANAFIKDMENVLALHKNPGAGVAGR